MCFIDTCVYPAKLIIRNLFFFFSNSKKLPTAEAIKKSYNYNGTQCASFQHTNNSKASGLSGLAALLNIKQTV
ncbi:MAG: hypothetical protein NT000_05190, partial [Proteobacteria bacterium]|nr:hypothetical protein [Pseudomonadota bacterium]